MNSIFKKLVIALLFLITGSSAFLAQSGCTPTIAASNNSICAGMIATLTASGASNYTWSPSANLSSSFGASVLVFQAGIYTVTASSNTCVATATIQIFSVQMPTVSISASAGMVCPSYHSTLTAFGATTYTWTGTSFSATGFTTITPVYQQSIAVAAGQYTVTGANGGCVSPTPAFFNVSIAAPLAISAFLSPGTPICPGESATLAASGASIYDWSSGSTNSSLNPLVVSPTVTTTYTVVGYTSVCSGTSTLTVTVKNCATGISMVNELSSRIFVSPNPGSGLFSVTVQDLPGNLSLKTYDALGNTIRKAEFENERCLLNLEEFPDGIYTICIMSNGQAVSYRKIIKN